MFNLIMGSSYSKEESEIVQRTTNVNTPKGPYSSVNLITEGGINRQLDTQIIENTGSSNPEEIGIMSGREQGDGMEGPVEEISKPAHNDQSKMIELPNTGGLRLHKLPPIVDPEFIDMSPPPKPLVAMNKAKIYPKGTFPPSVRKQREPKFVPLEPYKAAVINMKEASKKMPLAMMGKPDLRNPSKDENSSLEDSDHDLGSDDIDPTLERNYRIMLDIKEKEIQSLKNRVECAENQNKIQTKVNAEIKKLLVASVGEDIEARVDFLTQDKARLAADVIQYNNKIATDWEEKDALGVESDIWRSKFLASTVIVEELTRNKEVLKTRVDQIEYGARCLLAERNTMRANLASIQNTINKLNSAFDPLNKEVDPGLLDNLKATEHLVKTTRTLYTRLVGSTEVPDKGKDPQLASLHHMADSPAEAKLRNQLKQPVKRGSEPQIPTEEACNILAKDARIHLLKLGDMRHQHSDKDGFKTCSHCSGSVQVV